MIPDEASPDHSPELPLGPVEAADGLSATPLVQMPPSSTAAIAEPGAGEFGSAVREQAPQRLPRMLRALRHADFRYFWFGNFLSNIGTWMQNVAQGWLVLDLSNSAWWLGVIGFAASAPMLLFTLFGGAIADNVNKRRLLMVTQSAMMVLAFVMAALAYWKEITVAQIAELAFLNGTAMALNTPSYQALYPALLPREDLGNAIALNSAQFNMSRVLGPTLGGFAMAWIGVSGNFFLNGLSFLAVLVALARIHYPEEQRRSEASIWQRLGEGFRYVFGSDAMRALTLLVSVASLLAIPYITFIPLFARDILGVGERGLGILMAFSGIGAFAGAVVVAQSRRESGRGRVILLMGCAFYAAVIAFCLSRNFLLSGVLQAAAGFCMIVMVAHLNTLMQHLASDEMRGRVMSIYATAFLGLAPLGSLVAGSLSHRFGAPLALGGMNALALIGSLLVYANSPALRKLQ